MDVTIDDVSEALKKVAGQLATSATDNEALSAKLEDIEARATSMADTTEAALADLSEQISLQNIKAGQLEISDEQAVTEFGEMALGTKTFDLNESNQAALPKNISNQLREYKEKKYSHRGLVPSMTSGISNFSYPAVRGGVAGGHVTNGFEGTRAHTDRFDIVEVPATFSNIYTRPQISLRMLTESPFHIGAILLKQMQTALGTLESTDFWTGTGIAADAQMLGLLNMPTDPAEVDGKFREITGALAVDLYRDLHLAMRAEYLPGSRYYVSRPVYAELYKELNTDKPVTVMNGGGIAVFGYPVSVVEELPAPAADANSVLFGNMGDAALLIDAPTISVDGHLISADKPQMKSMYVEESTGLVMTDSRALIIGKLA